jgi:putative transposase
LARRKARLPSPEVEALVTAAIEDFYLTRRGPTMSQLMREVERRSAELGLVPPSRKAVTARIRLRDQVEVLRRRHGDAHVRAKLGRIVDRLSIDEPLGVVQVDHTLADVILVSERERRALGRPWLTPAIDVATRVVAGFHLSPEAPSSLSIAMVLNHAVLPEDGYLRERGIHLVWPVAGLPERLHLDNAKELRGKALVRGASQYGVELVYRPPAAPHWGGHIERLIGTTMGAPTILPGATGRSAKDRPSDAEASAAVTMAMLAKGQVRGAGPGDASARRAFVLRSFGVAA